VEERDDGEGGHGAGRSCSKRRREPARGKIKSSFARCGAQGREWHRPGSGGAGQAAGARRAVERRKAGGLVGKRKGRLEGMPTGGTGSGWVQISLIYFKPIQTHSNLIQSK
jgi:hypothetical protein